MELRLPLRQIFINQPFGVNYLDFYKKMGLDGHNGVDFRAYRGFSCYAANSGVITVAGTMSDGGIEVEIWDVVQGIKTLYYHLVDYTVKVGDKVKAGDLIGHCDNTGIYTTGDHLHFGLKFVDSNGNTLNYNNGYKGAINPAPYFRYAYNGFVLEDKWDAPNVLQRYYRADKRNLLFEKRIMLELWWYFKHLPSNEQIKACVYGAWGRDDVANPLMRDLWAFETKSDMTNNKHLFRE